MSSRIRSAVRTIAHHLRNFAFVAALFPATGSATLANPPQTAPIDRLDEIRSRLLDHDAAHGLAGASDGFDRSQRLSWLNWPNWGNWGNWGNWNNWQNWQNWNNWQNWLNF